MSPVKAGTAHEQRTATDPRGSHVFHGFFQPFCTFYPQPLDINGFQLSGKASAIFFIILFKVFRFIFAVVTKLSVGDDIIEEFHQKYVPRTVRKDKERRSGGSDLTQRRRPSDSFVWRDRLNYGDGDLFQR